MPPRKSNSSPVAVTMMSASSSRPEVSRSPLSVKRSIRSVTTDAAPAEMALKRSPFGDGAEALVPGVVAGREVRGDVVAGGQLALQALGEHAPDQLRVLPAHLVEDLGQDGMEPLRGGAGLFRRQDLAEHGHDGALLGQARRRRSASAAAWSHGRRIGPEPEPA